MNCSQCGNELDPGAAFCGNCGAQLVPQPVQPVVVAAQAPIAPQPVQPQQAYAPPQQPQPVAPQPVAPPAPPVVQPVAAPTVPQPAPQQVTQAPLQQTVPAYAVPRAQSKSSTKAIVGLVLGVLSLFGWLIPIVGVALGIASVVLGSLSRKDSKGMAIASIILGAIGTILSLLVWILAVVALSNERSITGNILGIF